MHISDYHYIGLNVNLTHGYTTAREHLSHWFNSDYVSFRSRIQNKKYANLLTCISEEYWIAMRND